MLLVIYLSYTSTGESLVHCIYCFFFTVVFVFYSSLSVNGMMLRVKAKELSTDEEFKATAGWYHNWKSRHSIFIRTLTQRLPADMEENIATFHWFVLRSRKHCEYPPSHIINMDETMKRFEVPATQTLEFTGSQTMAIITCSADKWSFIVALAGKANGEKLLRLFIFLLFCDVSNYWAHAFNHVSYLRLLGSLFTFDHHLIVSALVFGFTGNSLKYFLLYLSFIGKKEWVLAGVGLVLWTFYRGRERTAGAKKCRRGCNSWWPHSSSPTPRQVPKQAL